MEDHFPANKKLIVNYKKISTPGPVPKNWLGFSYIRSKDYKLCHNFDNIYLKNDHTIHPTIKLKNSRNCCGH